MANTKRKPTRQTAPPETDQVDQVETPPEAPGLTEGQRAALRAIRSAPLDGPERNARQIIQDCRARHAADRQRIDLDHQLIDQASSAFLSGAPVDD